MKKLIKIAIFPVLTVLLLCGLLIYSKDAKNNFAVEEASGSDGLIYADYFTGNSAHYEWQFEYTQYSKTPIFVNDMMMMDGFSSNPSFAMLQYTLPSKCDIYFTAEVARRGEGTNRDPAVFLNVGETFQNRYMLYLKEGGVALSYNGTKDLVNKRVENLTVGQANSFRLSLDGTKLSLYMDGGEEPLFTYEASEAYANLAQARNFGVWGVASEFYFDDLVITNGNDLLPVTELVVSGKGNNCVEGIGTQMQMEAMINPSNSTDRAVVWSVDNEELAEITSGGLLKAKGYGTVTVTAKTRDGSGVEASCELKIGKVEGAKENEEVVVSKKPWTLADDYNIVFESDDPLFMSPMSPFVTVLESGRILVTFDLNYDGVLKRTPIGYDEPQESWGNQHVVVAYSDDDGETWELSFECDGIFARAFEDGDRVYMLRRDMNRTLSINYSEDEGETWSESFVLDNRTWHSAPTTTIYSNGYLYTTMEVNDDTSLAPVLLRAKCGDDLTKKENWTISEPLSIAEAVPDSMTSDLDYTGIMEYSTAKDGLNWLEGNVIQMHNEDSYWYDASMKSFYILLRSQAWRSGYAAVLKITENEDGSMTPSLVETEAGNKQLFVAMPGGHDKFSIIYDEASGLYWLSSNYSENSIINRKYTTGDMQGKAFLERQKLALYFSTDAMNWNFAGMITEGDTARESRSYPHMVVDGDDLLLVSRTGTEESSSMHDNNLLTLHRIENFRDLVY